MLVTRTVKDGQLRMVFWNEIKPTEESGGAPVEAGTCFSSIVYLVGRGWPSSRTFNHATDVVDLPEFHDLWHSLVVPNDVDLLKQLESGTSAFSLSFGHYQSSGIRGPTGHECRSSCSQGSDDEEERQAGRSAPPTSSADYKHAHEGRNRPFARLGRSREVKVCRGCTYIIVIIHRLVYGYPA